QVPPPTGTPPETTDPYEPVVPTSVLQFVGPAPTNLVLISLDTTRRDFIGRFAGNGNTPNLDQKLAEGVVLEDHRSCSSWTGPSMTCVTTGRTPFDLNWFPWTSDEDVSDVNRTMPTLAGQLQFQRGFHTTLVTANAVMGPVVDLDRGYEVVQNLDYYPATVVTDTALVEADALAGSIAPFFLHVHYMDPHGPYCPPAEYLDEETYALDLCDEFGYLSYTIDDQSAEWQQTFLDSALTVYDAELDYWDDEFQRLWDGLDAAGMLDDALVVFVTDHGEQFYERGGFGHGNTLAAEENRSTAMFWAKNLLPQVWTGPTVHEDLGATLMNAYGIVPPEPLNGIEVGLAPPDRVVRSMLYWGCCGSAQLSVTRDELQLTYDFWGEKHLWDYALDPTGRVDYYDPADPDVQALWLEMRAYVDEVLTKWPSAGPASDLGP
ncbi:MAG: sulfatase-like hydrolase/transferase, partial [Myxococcota bacterium]